MFSFLILAVIAYLCGSICSAIIVCKFMNLPDPRTEGSHNPGATNVLRIGGKQPAAVVLVADALKGLIPVLLAKMFGLPPFFQGCIALIALLGHIFPVFFKFQGGRGVATMLGGVLGLSLLGGILTILTWALVVYFTRYSSLGAIVAAILAPVYTLLFGHAAYFLPILAMSVIVIWRHWENIERLRTGTEPKIDFKTLNEKKKTKT